MKVELGQRPRVVGREREREREGERGREIFIRNDHWGQGCVRVFGERGFIRRGGGGGGTICVCVCECVREWLSQEPDKIRGPGLTKLIMLTLLARISAATEHT